MNRRLLALLAVLAAVLIAAAGAGAWYWWTSQPHAKLGSTDVEFETNPQPPPPPPKLAELPWRMYGYDDARTHFTPVHRHRPPFARVWMVPARHYIEFPATVADGRVFVAQEKGRFFAIDADTGKILWDRQYRNCAASSPLVRGDVVYQSFIPWPCPYGSRDVPGLIVAVDARTGKELWRFRDSGPSESSLLAVGRLLYFGSWDHKVYAVDLDTRRVRWATETDAEIDSSPAYADGVIYIGTNGGSMYAIDARSGVVRWRSTSYSHFPRGREYFYATPAVAYGRVFAGNTDGWVYAYGAHTGHLLGRSRRGHTCTRRLRSGTRRCTSARTTARCTRSMPARGRLRWTYEASGSIHGAPTVMDGLVYFSVCGNCGRSGVRDTKEGPPSTFALDARTGKLVWTFWDGRYSPVVADEKHVYIMGKSRVWAVDPCPNRRSPDRLQPYRNILKRC